MESVLLKKSIAFSVAIVRICKTIQKEKKEYVLTKQLLRSGTSIGANIAEAQHGQTKADMYAKFQIALKECGETLYWLAVLSESGYLDDIGVFDHCLELKRLLVASSNTIKKSLPK